MAKITSNYDYITSSQKSIIESNIPEKLTVIQDNLLDFQISFSSFDWLKPEMEKIARELVSMGRYFAAQHRLDETHTLINGIKAEVTNNYGVKFYNDARNSRGQFYAGHHEYGYKARDGGFVEARPFMRPALYAVSRASQGEIATILEELLKGVFSEDGYNGIKNLTFGKGLGRHVHNSPGNTVLSSMMESSTINPRTFIAGTSLESQTRKPWSVRRTVFSDKRNEAHKEDIGWRSIKGSIRSGRSIQKSTKAAVLYKYANSPKSKISNIIYRKNKPIGLGGKKQSSNGESFSGRKKRGFNRKKEREQYNLKTFGNKEGKRGYSNPKTEEIVQTKKIQIHKEDYERVGKGRNFDYTNVREGRKFRQYKYKEYSQAKITDTRLNRIVTRSNRITKKENKLLGMSNTEAGLVYPKKYKTPKTKKTVERHKDDINSASEKRVVRLFNMNPVNIPSSRYNDFSTEYTMSSEDLKAQGYIHYADNMYYR